MNEIISLQHFLSQNHSKEILQLNDLSREHGLMLTEQEAVELSETYNRAVKENDRIGIGLGIIPDLVKIFSASKYVTEVDYGYILSEVTSMFYYIKTVTNDVLNDEELIKELFKRFELKCRGSIDLLGTEAERLIRKLISGRDYSRWYWDRDELYMTGRDMPDEYLPFAYDEEHFEVYELADHDYYDPEEIEGVFEEAEDGIDLDAFDDFFVSVESDEDDALEREEDDEDE